MTKIDAVTLDIVKDALVAVSNEVFYAFAQTSMSPVIYETLDYATGITDADGNLLTQGNGACGFIGTISPLVQAIIEKFGKENLNPGDVFIINDPYMGGGTHLSDIGMCMPVFYQDELIAFIGNKAHWTDVGGTYPGSFTMKATELFQEGLCFSGIKIVDKGELVQGIYDMMCSNVRYPALNEGDMWGQISSLRTGYNRLNDLCDKYSLDVLKGAMARLLDQGELMARKRLKEMPKGVFEMEDYLDDDGNGNMVKVKVKVTITDDEFIADFTGSSPQVASTINAGFTAAGAGVKIVYMAIMGADLIANDGIFRPIRVITEEGSVLRALPPAPTSCYFESLLLAGEVVWRALAPHFPEYLGAGHMLSVCAVVQSGINPATGESFLIVEPTGGGWGASAGKDGEVGQFCVADGETYNVPVEMAETRYGIRINEFSLHTDGQGAGEYRGGSGCVRTYEALSDNQFFSANFGRNKINCWGFGGGKDGSNNNFAFYDKDGRLKDGPMGTTAQYQLNTGDSVRMVCASGGGYGNPLARKEEMVIWDVKNEYITIEQALEDYGIILDPKTLAVTGYSDARKAYQA